MAWPDGSSGPRTALPIIIENRIYPQSPEVLETVENGTLSLINCPHYN